MKRIIALSLAVLMFAVSCGRPLVLDGKEYETIGVIEMMMDENDPKIQYEPSWGNIIWGVVLIETVIAPIYFFGFSCMNPVAEKTN